MDKDKVEGSIRVMSSNIDTSLLFKADVNDYYITKIETPLEMIKSYYGVKRYSIDIPEIGEVKVEAMDRKNASKALLNYLLEKHKDDEITIAGKKLRKDNVDHLSNYLEKEFKELEDNTDEKVLNSSVNPDGFNRPWAVVETRGQRYLQKLSSKIFGNSNE